MATWFVVVQALWLFLPAYLANMAPVFAAKILPRFNAPIDAGRTARDGKRVLGDSKTWRGLLAGGAVGAVAAAAQSQVHRTSWDLSDFAHGSAGGVWAPVLIGLLMGLGAGVGDAVKSYFKRRTGRQGGAPWVPFDQLDFVVFGLAFAALAGLLVQLAGADANWFLTSFVEGDGWIVLLVIVLLTPALHFLVNVIGYKLGLKKVPW